MACDIWHRDIEEDIKYESMGGNNFKIVRQSQWITQLFDNSHLMIDEG